MRSSVVVNFSDTSSGNGVYICIYALKRSDAYFPGSKRIDWSVLMSTIIVGPVAEIIKMQTKKLTAGRPNHVCELLSIEGCVLIDDPGSERQVKLNGSSRPMFCVQSWN